MKINIHRLFDIPFMLYHRYGDEHPTFYSYASGSVVATPVKEYINNSNYISDSLLDKGLKQGDHVITILNNSPAWNAVEIGILQAGGIHVPLSPFYTTRQLENIIKLVRPSWAFCSSQGMEMRLQSIVKALSLNCGITNFKTVRLCNNNAASKNLEKRKESISSDDTAVVLFTSGSTGIPKGVALSHENILTSVKEFSNIDVFRNCKRSISFLQLAQSAEKKVNYSCQLNGISICYPTPHRDMLNNIRLFQPQITALVPYLLSELYLQLKFPGTQQVSLRNILCGGASVPQHLIRQFKKKAIKVFEVYGLTETASLLSYNTYKNNKIGTVGKIADSVEVMISNEGEVCVKGNNIMKGYLLESLKLDKALDANGWFHTGDIATIDKNDFLKITGRKKNAFKNSRGSYVHPEEIEQELMKHPLFDHVIITGENADSLCVIFKLRDNLPKNDEIYNQIRSCLKEFNKGKNEELKISQFMMLNDLSHNELVSSSMKLDRKRVLELMDKDKFISVY